MWSEDVVCTLDQQTSKIGIASLGDAELWIALAGLTASWSQAEIAAHVTTSVEAFLIAQSQNEGESGDVPNTVNLHERLGLWILSLCQLLDLAIVLLDLQCRL